MDLKRLISSFLVLATCGALVLGCKGQAGPKLYPVKGKITHKGQPLEGASVLFKALDGSASGAGRTDATGQYEINPQWGKGLPQGEYLVAVTKFETPPIPETETEDEAYNPAAANMEAPSPKSLIPQKYAIPEQSGLKATVTAEQKSFDFDLTD